MTKEKCFITFPPNDAFLFKFNVSQLCLNSIHKGAKTFSIMTFAIMTLRIMTLSIMTLNIMTYAISINRRYAECYNAECCIFILLC